MVKISFVRDVIYLSLLGDSDERIPNEHPELCGERLELQHLSPILLGVMDGGHWSIVEPSHVNHLITFPLFHGLLLVCQHPVIDAMGLVGGERERERERERGE